MVMAEERKETKEINISLWETYVTKQKKKEILYLSIIFLVFAIGSIEDIMNLNDFALFIICNYQSISLVAIQIQTTIFTLVIALLALLGGTMEGSYLGVRYNDFVLNIKPIYLKQKHIITVCLIFIVVSISSEFIGFYNIVISALFATMVLIYFSIKEIYDAFTMSTKFDDEIESYIISKIEKKDNILKMFESFCKQWINEITKQSFSETEIYKNVFKKYFVSLVSEDSTREFLVDKSADLAKSLLKNSGCEIQGIKFVNDCYNWVYEFVIENKTKDYLKKQKIPFNLFANLNKDIIDSLLKTKIADVENRIHMDWFIDVITQVNYLLCFNGENKNLELTNIINFGYFIGTYISPRNNSNSINDRDDDYWFDSLSRTYYILNVPETLRAECEKTLIEYQFNYMMSLIYHGETEVVKEYFYNRALKGHYKFSYDYVFMVLKIHCFLYYLAVNETTECISEEFKQKICDLIFDNEVAKTFKDFLLTISETDKNILDIGGNQLDIFNTSLISCLANSLRKYEQFPKNGNAKTCLIDRSIEQFTVFIMVYLADYYGMEDIVNKVISEESSVGMYLNFISENKQINAFKKFLKIVAVSDNIDERTNALYSRLENQIKKKYKEYIINFYKEKKISQKELKVQKDLISKKTFEYLKKQFPIFTSKCDGDLVQCTLLRIRCNSDMVYDLIDDLHLNIFQSFIEVIKNILAGDEKLSSINRDSFSSDGELLKYIKKCKKMIIIGSENNLLPKNYKRREEFKDAIYEAEHYTSGANGLTLILNKEKIKIYIEDVETEMHNQSIPESGANYDKATKMYQYASIENMPVNFTKKELENFLKDSAITISIKLSIRISAMDGKVGEVLTK